MCNRKVLNIFLVVVLTLVSKMNAQQFLLQHKSNGKIVRLDAKREMSFALKSDSVLLSDTITGKFPLWKDKLFAVKDSVLIMQSGYQIKKNDLLFIAQLPKKYHRQKIIFAPVFAFGFAVFTRGLLMLGEGFESTNKTAIPAHLGVGAALLLLTGKTYIQKENSYRLTDWELMQLK